MAIVTPDLAAIWRGIQVCLLPNLQECLDEPLTERLKQFVRVLEIVRIEEHVSAPPELVQGRPRQDRRFLARAFLAKAVYNLPKPAHNRTADRNAPAPAQPAAPVRLGTPAPDPPPGDLFAGVWRVRRSGSGRGRSCRPGRQAREYPRSHARQP